MDTVTDTKTCPCCGGATMHSNGARDPQAEVVVGCDTCAETGVVPVTAEDGALARMATADRVHSVRAHRDTARRDAAHAAQIERDLQWDLTDRDREWWA